MAEPIPAVFTPDTLAPYLNKTGDQIRWACRNGTIPEARRNGKFWEIPASYLFDQLGVPPAERLQLLAGS